MSSRDDYIDRLLEMIRSQQVPHQAGAQLIQLYQQCHPTLFGQEAIQPAVGREVAVIGMSGRFPGAMHSGIFWDNLMSGKNAVTRVPADRWGPEAGYPAQAVGWFSIGNRPF